jgi:hypothetical protein
MSQITLFDLVTKNNNDVLTGLVEDVTTFAPEFSVIPVVTRPGISYTICRRATLPVGGFRGTNMGVTPTSSTYKKEIKEMFFLDIPINVDEAIVKGDDRSIGDILSLEAQGALQGGMITIGSQFYYGDATDGTYGFNGLRTQFSGVATCGGTTNSTTAYAVWLNPHGVSFDVGQDGAIALPAPMRQQISDPNNSGKNYFAYVTNLSCFIGLSVKSDKSVWGCTGIDATHALSDKSGSLLIKQIPLVRRNGLTWLMNRTAAQSLQAQRSSIGYQPALNGGGSVAWAPKPTELEGYPIVVTDSITDTENNT